MKKWNMIIDVAECTNCQLCTLATMDEYVGNDWPGYTKPMPKHGHKWINILQKERGQVPMIDIAYVPTMCNHCDEPIQEKRLEAVPWARHCLRCEDLNERGLLIPEEESFHNR